MIDQENELIRNPFNTLNRTYRYAKYGYFPCLETKIKIVNAIRQAENFNEDDVGRELYNGLD